MLGENTYWNGPDGYFDSWLHEGVLGEDLLLPSWFWEYFFIFIAFLGRIVSVT